MAKRPEGEMVRCDNVGCRETYPRFHSEIGPGFDKGRWLGWHFLDLNRFDLFPRPLAFCGLRCLIWWLTNTETAWHAIGWQTEYDALLTVLAHGPSRKRDA